MDMSRRTVTKAGGGAASRRLPRVPSMGHASDAALMQTVCEFVDICNAATSLDEIETDLGQRLAQFGIRHFVLVQALDASRRPNGALIAGPSNREWRDFYFQERWARHDTLMKSGLHRLAPITWRAFHRERQLSAEPRKLYDAARGFGFVDGYFLPIHMLDGSVACVSMFAEDELPSRGPAANALHLMSLYYSFAARRILMPPTPARNPAISLTPRQRECLQWVRAGKTDWEIGQIIGISEHTVIEHLDEARRRLGVRTRTQAVIEAVARGLIHI
jgi:LuxR family quorum sensing-dependent transcriptional regulator